MLREWTSDQERRVRRRFINQANVQFAPVECLSCWYRRRAVERAGRSGARATAPGVSMDAGAGALRAIVAPRPSLVIGRQALEPVQPVCALWKRGLSARGRQCGGHDVLVSGGPALGADGLEV